MTPALRRTFKSHATVLYTDAHLIRTEATHFDKRFEVNRWLERHGIAAHMVVSLHVRGSWAKIEVIATNEKMIKTIAKNTDTLLTFEQIFKVRYPVPAIRLTEAEKERTT